MFKSSNTHAGKSGLPPGSLVHVGSLQAKNTKLSIIKYSKDAFQELELSAVFEIKQYINADQMCWVNIEGLASIKTIEEIGETFGIHKLVLEDILNTHQRPKFEEYEDHLFIVLKNLTANEQMQLSSEQISILVFENLIITFKEKENDLFQPIEDRLQHGKGSIRSLESDYLMYALLDRIVDQNFILLDELNEAINSIEDSLLTVEPTQKILDSIQHSKRQVASIRRRIAPVRELLLGVLRSESVLVSKKTHIYLKDVYDHLIHVIESIESYRESLNGLLDIYLSKVSNRMNEVMKVLTIFSTIFIPLTFVAGIYGMNFKYMPELEWRFAYPLLWLFFILVPLAFIGFFKKKKWL